MQIFVKDLTGNSKLSQDQDQDDKKTNKEAAFPLSVPQTTSIGNLRSLLALRFNKTESEFRLVYGGKVLTSLTELLSASNIGQDSTINMALPVRGGAPKKVRCTFKDCKEPAQRIVGDCGFCPGHFCGKHRMLEAHQCAGLEDCKAQDKERNKEKLESERTVAIRGI